MKMRVLALLALLAVCSGTRITPLLGEGQGGATAVDLGGKDWRVASSNGSISAAATVPGVIHLDLLKAKVIEDPYVRYRDVEYRWIALTDWAYSRRFSVSADLLAHAEVVLVCEGLDTVASVAINGKVIGYADNMFRRYLFPVPTDLLRSGPDNAITVSFTSAETYAKSQVALTPYELPSADNFTQQSGEPFRNYIRKEQCSFSWDWGPAFMPQGIYKPIALLGYTSPVITALVPQTFVVGAAGSRNFRVEVETVLLVPSGTGASVSGMLKVSVAGASQNIPCQLHAGENRVRATLLVSNVDLWWPVGYGAQPLYSLTATFTPSSALSDDYDHDRPLLAPVSADRQVGFRAVELVTDKYSNQKGSSMFFRVNGVPIFAKGANFVPMDSFENRVTDQDMVQLVQDALDANMNVLRVWGGGVYQQDKFYQLCDEKGIMVWQEFMFACAMYPRDEKFLATTAAEVTYQVERLTHHPSIILWSGSNENEAALDWFGSTRTNPRLYVVDYAKLYFDTIRETLLTLDASRPFWPSSPSNGVLEQNPFVGIWGNPYDLTMGDLHYYNYGADCTDVANFPSPRFASEYGYQSFPSFETWRPVTQQGDWHPFSDLMLHRQHHPDGNAQVLAQIQHYFRYNVTDSLQSFKDFLYLSQATQALCVKAQSEHYRRSKGMAANTMGAIYWQLNDIWQAPTWSSLEYGGRWKLLHHYVKHFFAPVLVSAYEQPTNSLQVHITSDVNQELSGALYTRLWSWGGVGALAEWKTAFSLAPLASKPVLSDSVSSLISGKCKQRADCFLTFSVVDGSGNEVASNVYYLANIIQSALPKPTISVQVSPGNSSQEAFVMLISDYAAPFVHLDTSYPLKGRFEDNGFLLLPRTPRKITFLATSADEPIDIARFQRELVVRSPRDVY